LLLEPLEDRNLFATGLGVTAPEQFATGLYAHLLGRQPVGAEIENWALQLDNGTTPGAVVRSFVDSAEFRGDWVQQAYGHYLHRNAGAGELAAWVGQMQAGLSYESFVSNIVASPEYIQDHGGANVNWLVGLYTDVLGRSPDQGGLVAWNRVLQQGVPPIQIAQAFVHSNEGLAIQAATAYQTVLGRSADPGGLAYWTGQLQQGLSVEQLRVLFGTSGEFIAKQASQAAPSYIGSSQAPATPGVTLAVPDFSTSTTPTVSIDVNPTSYTGTASIDVDLNHDGSFTDPGDAGQTTGTITPANHQLVMNALPDGTYTIRARAQNPGGADFVSAPLTLTVNMHEGFMGSSVLLGLYNDYTTDLATTGTLPANFGKLHPVLFDPHARVGVNVHSTLPQYLNAMAPDLANLGMVIAEIYPAQQMVIGYLPITMIPQLMTLPHFASVTPIYRPVLHTGSAISQGDGVIKGPQFRSQFNVDGTGESIGVLSDSVDEFGGGLPQSFATGDLIRGKVTVLEDDPSGFGTDEGRAMMEIIADVAPQANLIYHTGSGGPQDYARGILQEAQFGAKVEVDDISYLDEPMFNDGVIGQAIDQVHSQGVFYASAAGNDGPGAFLTNWQSVDGVVGGVPGTFLNLGSGRVLQSFRLPLGAVFTPSVEWDDAYLEGGSNLPNFQVPTQINVYITSADGTQVFAAATDDNTNTGEALQIPAFFNDGTFGTDQFAMAFQLIQGPAPTMLRWVSNSDSGLDLNALGEGGPAIFGHTTAAGAVAVGAAPWYQPNIPEPFTSVGGSVPFLFDAQGNRLATPDIRNEPAITGPDGVSTSFFGAPANTVDPATNDKHLRFYGTSAAAPEVAAAAALSLEAAPGTSPDALFQGFARTTTPVVSAGFNNLGGFGMVQLVGSSGMTPITVPPVVPPTPPGPPAPPPTPPGGNLPPGTILPAPAWGQTSDTAAQLGVLNAGTVTYEGNAIQNLPNGMPANNWGIWTAGQAGTVSVSLQYTIPGGDLNFRLYTLDANGNLLPIAAGTALGVNDQLASVAVTAGQPLVIWIYGYNHAQGAYNLSVNLM
jgi:hypothetical protein